jgi:thiol-disulfide isomerase/thioredoxin
MSVTAFHFWSTTCGPCKAVKPALDDLKEEFPQVTWVSVNTHDDKQLLAGRYNVSVVPTIVVETKDTNNNILNIDRHSGTGLAGYYRIIRRAIQQL